jgi:phospholipid/cholesterol/gamma-HCH transport system ATP-binding protein
MAIEITNIVKGFGDKSVLKGIDFRFEQGKVNMIIGASGSGKSVMMKCIVGLMKPDGGKIMYDGIDFLNANFRDVRNLRKNMGMLFQYSALFDSMTVEENVGFPLRLFTKMTAKEMKKRVEFCLSRVNMANTNHLFPAELSGGMMKRVGIARAISLNPKYLFCDEPNSGLDPLTAKVIDELIQELTYEFNTCTVVVSHDMNSVINISDNIMFLYKGEKAWEGDKRTILRSGNENLDKFVFVSDLIRRDLFDEPTTETTPPILSKPAPEVPKDGPVVPPAEPASPPAEEIVPPASEVPPIVDAVPPASDIPPTEDAVPPSSEVPPSDAQTPPKAE